MQVYNNISAPARRMLSHSQDLHLFDCILGVRACVCFRCEFVRQSYCRRSSRKGVTQVHITFVFWCACIHIWFQVHYSCSRSPAVLDGLHACVTGGIIFAMTSISHMHSLFTGPHEALPLHLTPWKSMRASQRGVKIEQASKYTAKLKL